MRRLFGPRPATAAEAVRLADVTPPPSVELRTVGGRLVQVIETRPDGTKTAGTFTYVADVPTAITFDNPTRVVTFPVTAGAPTGWGVA